MLQPLPHMSKPHARIILHLCTALLLLSALSMGVGPGSFDPFHSFQRLFGAHDWQYRMLMELRLPRILLGLITGFAIGSSGAYLQSALRNPLADPGILGISSSAALGAVLALYLPSLGWIQHHAVFSTMTLTLLSFVFGLGACVLLFTLAKRGRSVILVGLSIHAVASALLSLVLALALAKWELGGQIVQWLMGGLEGKRWIHVAFTAPIVGMGGVALYLQHQNLDASLLGHEHAYALGVDPKKMEMRITLAVALMVSSTVATIGSAGLLGLMAPFVARKWVRVNHGSLFWVAGLVGALLLLATDQICHWLSSTVDIRPSMLSACAGALLFFVISSNKGAVS